MFWCCVVIVVVVVVVVVVVPLTKLVGKNAPEGCRVVDDENFNETCG